MSQVPDVASALQSSFTTSSFGSIFIICTLAGILLILGTIVGMISYCSDRARQRHGKLPIVQWHLSAPQQNLDMYDAERACPNQAHTQCYSVTNVTANANFSTPFWNETLIASDKNPIASGNGARNQQPNPSRSTIRYSHRNNAGLDRKNYTEKPPLDRQRCNICSRRAGSTAAVFYSCDKAWGFINVCSYCMVEIRKKSPGVSDHVTLNTTGTLLLSGRWVDVDLNCGR